MTLCIISWNFNFAYFLLPIYALGEILPSLATVVSLVWWKDSDTNYFCSIIRYDMVRFHKISVVLDCCCVFISFAGWVTGGADWCADSAVAWGSAGEGITAAGVHPVQKTQPGTPHKINWTCMWFGDHFPPIMPLQLASIFVYNPYSTSHHSERTGSINY